MRFLGFRSYRTKLQSAFVVLGLAAIAITGWETTQGAAGALREATFERLTAIRETRGSQIERYFEDAANHTLALSSDESTVAALEEFGEAWESVPPAAPGSPAYRSLDRYYRESLSPLLPSDISPSTLRAVWFPAEPKVISLQHWYLSGNPERPGQKDRLLAAPSAGRYGAAHIRYHPTLHRYQSAFGFYDVFLIDSSGRVLYSVFKEIDLGAKLFAPPYNATALARLARRALDLNTPEQVVTEDYSPYLPSYLAPAAFLAAPVWRRGEKIGVLALQLSANEINRVMSGNRHWRDEGLGETGHAYVAGADGTLRSDVRFEIEHPEAYRQALERGGISREVIERIRRYRTAILTLGVGEEVRRRIKTGASGTEIGLDAHGVPVLRSFRPLSLPGFNWFLIAEIEESEAFAPVARLRWRMLLFGGITALLFFAAATWLGSSVTRPVLALAANVGRLGRRDFGARIPVTSSDEIGQLALSFNQMAAELDRTTVSKEELEVLAGRLIDAQEHERRRIASELHDDVTQRMAALAIEAGLLERSLAAEEPARARAISLKEQLAQVAGDIHGLSRRLHPSKLDDLGLIAAIESEARAFFERGGPVVDFQHSGDVEILSPDAKLALYRIVQESLRNIQKHAAADEVSIRLRVGDRSESAELEIRDNGVGFDRNRPDWSPGIGLASIQERARFLGGAARIESAPGLGAAVTVRIPSHRKELNGTETHHPAG